MSAAYRWTGARKERMLRALDIAAQWEESLVMSLPADDDTGRARTEASAKEYRAMRGQLMAAWGYRETAR